IYAKQLRINAKRLAFNAKQLELDDKQLELSGQQRELDDEQRELNAQSSVSVVLELMASASARTTAIPVVDTPADNLINPTKSISPCLPIAAMPRLPVAALPAARPTAAQEGKRLAPINESPELPMAPKRHRGDGQITNDGATTGSSRTTGRSLSEQVAVERLIAALDVPAYFAPAAGAATFGNAPAVGFSDLDISALVAPTAGATTFGNAPAAGILAANVSAFAPAAGAPTFGVAPAISVSAVDFSDLFAPATSATTFGNAPAVGMPDLDISALVAPTAGATTFGNAPAAGILAANVSAFAPAAGAPTFGDAPAVGVSAVDFSDLFAPATSATTFGNAPAVGISAFGAPTFGDAPAISVSAVDFSDLFAPAAGATTFGNAPAVGAPTFGVAPAIGIPDLDISAFVTPAIGVPALVAPTVDVPNVDMRVSDSVTAAELLRMIYDVSGMVFDVSGEQVTSERLLVVLGEAPYVSLGYVLDAYRHIYGCALMPRTTSSQYRIATLARVVALEHWAPRLEGEVFEDIAGLDILCRRDKELGALRQNYREQLGLAEDPNAAVLGPRLCFVIVRMCQIPVDLLRGPMLSSMFLEVTGLDLHSLNVVTRNGVQPMEPSDLCEMVKTWINKLGRLLTKHNGMEQSLVEVRECNSFYEGQCSSSDTEGLVAKRMLMSNRFQSLLFLGLQEAKVEAVIKRLIYVSSKRISSRTKECLEQLSTSLQIQPDS
ncbi:hypothetical protein GGI09_005346, partial [Coemansia sp. S100]